MKTRNYEIKSRNLTTEIKSRKNNDKKSRNSEIKSR